VFHRTAITLFPFTALGACSTLEDGQRRQQPQAIDSFAGAGSDCSPDGKWVVWGSKFDPEKGVWKVPMEGGNSVRLSDAEAEPPIILPDGKTIAYSYEDPSANPPQGVAIMAFEGGPRTKHFDIFSSIGMDVVSVGGRQSLAPLYQERGRCRQYLEPADRGREAEADDPFQQRNDFKFRLVTTRQTVGYESWHNKTRRAADPRSQVTPSGA
jgi:hypothetical protein